MTDEAGEAGVEPIAYGFFQQFEALNTDWRAFPRHYLLYARSGAFQLEVADARWLLPPHRAAWIAAGVPIRVQAPAPVTSASVLFDRACLAPFDFTCRVFAVSPLAREMIQHAMRWGAGRDPRDAAADRFFLALADVCLELAAAPDRFWLPRARTRELASAVEYTLARLADPLNMVEVAAHAGVSERTLARRFAEEARMPWRQFLQRARMIRAMERLADPQATIADVVFDVGFESLSAFSTAFRRFTGESPSAYRRRFAAR